MTRLLTSWGAVSCLLVVLLFSVVGVYQRMCRFGCSGFDDNPALPSLPERTLKPQVDGVWTGFVRAHLWRTIVESVPPLDVQLPQASTEAPSDAVAQVSTARRLSAVNEVTFDPARATPTEPTTSAPPTLRLPIAYCLMLHRLDAMDMARTLLRVLYDPHHVFVVHFDADVPPEMVALFSRLIRSELGPEAENNMMFVRKIKTEWGDYSIVAVQMLCMETAMQFEWEYWINLSADTFPLLPNHEIEQVLQRQAPASFVHMYGVYPNVPRYSYRVHMAGARCRLYERATRQCRRLNAISTGDNVGFGSQWAIIHRSFAEYILRRNESRLDEWEKYFKKYIVPDESFFQTMAIMTNLPVNMTIHPYNMFFIKWNSDGCARPSDGNHPCSLTHAEVASVDLGTNATEPVLFARKFPHPPCYLPHVRSHCIFPIDALASAA